MPRLAFTDHRRVEHGREDRPGTRNTPSLFNVVYKHSFFWDGRASTLRAQAFGPLTNPVEQAFPSQAAMVAAIRSNSRYLLEFQEAFDISRAHITAGLVVKALNAYECTLLAGNSAFDLYFYGHQKTALTQAAIRGLALFRGRAGCASCHTIGRTYALFTDERFHQSPMGMPSRVTARLGELTQLVFESVKHENRSELERLIATNADVAALGRFVVTLNPRDIGKFETPSLRDVALTPPYMHNGSIATLAMAVDEELYRRGKVLKYPIPLTVTERHDLVAFLQSLSSPNAASDSTASAAIGVRAFAARQ
jgi:cytochrome c peroxidase